MYFKLSLNDCPGLCQHRPGTFYHPQPSYFLRVSSSIQKWPNTMGLGHIDIFHRPSPGPFRNEFCNQLDCIERHIIHVR